MDNMVADGKIWKKDFGWNSVDYCRTMLTLPFQISRTEYSCCYGEVHDCSCSVSMANHLPRHSGPANMDMQVTVSVSSIFPLNCSTPGALVHNPSSSAGNISTGSS